MKKNIQYLKKYFDALIFDFDGTLMNTMPAHNQAWIETLLKYKVEISEKELQSLAGIPNLKTAELLCTKYNINLDPESISNLKSIRAEELLIHAEPYYEVEEVVRSSVSHFKLAIVSGSQKHLISPLLQKYNLENLFEVVITCEDTIRGKPHPDPFLLGAKKLSVDPEKCLVFEDGQLGIEAALKAKMKTLFVKDGHILWN